MNKFNCDICNYSTEDRSNYANHLKTPKHLQKELGEEKKAKEYKCGECNYTCFDSSNFSKHKKSLAHRIKIGEVEKVKKVDCVIMKLQIGQISTNTQIYTLKIIWIDTELKRVF